MEGAGIGKGLKLFLLFSGLGEGVSEGFDPDSTCVCWLHGGLL